MTNQTQAVQTARATGTIDPIKFLQVYQEFQALDVYSFEYVRGLVKGLSVSKDMAEIRKQEESNHE